jgi:very-short-patch-repair endonuclease
VPQAVSVRSPLRRKQMKYGLAANLRADPTDAEYKLWLHLRRKRTSDYRFRRQQPAGPFIVDFYCPAAKLIVELDGDQHGMAERQAYDEVRTRWLSARGHLVLRFGNGEVLKNMAGVLDCIERAVTARTPQLPSQ